VWAIAVRAVTADLNTARGNAEVSTRHQPQQRGRNREPGPVGVPPVLRPALGFDRRKQPGQPLDVSAERSGPPDLALASS
jgi:hypothetical protein